MSACEGLLAVLEKGRLLGPWVVAAGERLLPLGWGRKAQACVASK